VSRAVRDPDGDVVALKVLRRELSYDDPYRRRLIHEARAAGEARHRHLVPVLDAGEEAERSYLAVSFVSGRTLEQRIHSEGPLPLADAVRLLAPCGRRRRPTVTLEGWSASSSVASRS